ncbi:hypothetical protein GGS26DRAFT_587565 [Hypomontagnella submonticulosa]|nr:hypothetical protein GGS26DRAFT_587565 [Hypomontagnella submonticulosa]
MPAKDSIDFIKDFWSEKKDKFLTTVGGCTFTFKVEREALGPSHHERILRLLPPGPQKTIIQAIPTLRIYPSVGNHREDKEVQAKFKKALRHACKHLQPYFQYFRVYILHRLYDTVTYASYPRMIHLEVPGLWYCYVHWKCRDTQQLERFLRDPSGYWEAHMRQRPVSDRLGRHFHPPNRPKEDQSES